MKFLNKVALFLFSWVVLLLSIVLCGIIFGWIGMGQIEYFVNNLLYADTASKVVLGVSIVFILLAVKTIFFTSNYSLGGREGQGVLLENDNGKLMISKETLENLVNSVAKGYEGTEEIHTRIELDKNNNVNVYANLVVGTDVIIKDLSSKLQNDVKEKVKNATDLEVKEVNIKIKNVAAKKQVENK